MHMHLCNRRHTELASTFPDSNVKIDWLMGTSRGCVFRAWQGGGRWGEVTSHHHRQTGRHGEGGLGVPQWGLGDWQLGA